LRIAVTVDPYIPVPPDLYGGIERVVDFVVRGLVSRGHQVTLFAHPGSKTPAELIPYGVPPHKGTRARIRELTQLGGELWRRRNQLDVVLSWGRLASLVPVLPVRSLAKIQCYQRDGVPWRSIRRAVRIAGKSVRFAGCSSSVYRDARQNASAGHWRTIFNGVDPVHYTFVEAVPADAPLVFLGRIESIKGVHNAITVSKATGRRLVIAGNIPPEGREHFERCVAPHLDGELIRYVGPVNDSQKDQLLGSAAALLMLIEWEEPFGIVMTEALACGTPVIAFSRGSVPEVIRNGLNGFICNSVEDAISAVHSIPTLDRRAARRDCETRFSSSVLVDQYERLCGEMVEACAKS